MANFIFQLDKIQLIFVFIIFLFFLYIPLAFLLSFCYFIGKHHPFSESGSNPFEKPSLNLVFP